MATRAQVAASAETRDARLKAIATLAGQPLPLPSDPRTSPIDYTDDLPDEAQALGANGLSDAQIAAHWCIAAETLMEWADAHPALNASLARARTAAQAWWEETARRAIVTGDNRYPAGVFAQVMRARFIDYRERVEINHHLDIRALVHVSRDEAEAGLPDERTVGGAKRLKALKAVRLDASHTASGDLQIDALTPGEPSAGDPGNTGPDKA